MNNKIRIFILPLFFILPSIFFLMLNTRFPPSQPQSENIVFLYRIVLLSIFSVSFYFAYILVIEKEFNFKFVRDFLRLIFFIFSLILFIIVFIDYPNHRKGEISILNIFLTFLGLSASFLIGIKPYNASSDSDKIFYFRLFLWLGSYLLCALQFFLLWPMLLMLVLPR